MTLDTRIGIINPELDTDTVFTFCASLLGADDNYQYERSELFGGIAARGGQGYPAWLIVNDSEPGYIEVSFDTAYGYMGPNGESCSDLHAWLIREIARWVPEGTTMFWLDEYSDTWFKVNFGDGMEDDLLHRLAVSHLGDPTRHEHTGLAAGGTG